MSNIWDPERIITVGWIMDKYARYLQTGDRIRLGQEGDPCSLYRSSDEAPCATVRHVTRDSADTVRFRAVLDGPSEMEIELDNRNVAPDRIWEIHPDDSNTFRGRVIGEQEEEGEHSTTNGPTDDIVEDLDTRLKAMEYRGTDIERVLASAVRELAGDLLRTYRGEEPTFAYKFADRYDRALTSTSSFRASDTENGRRNTDDRHNFSLDDGASSVQPASYMSDEEN